MSVRLKRLSADYEKVRSLFQGTERIRLVERFGSPPERYVLEFQVNSLREDVQTGRIVAINTLQAAISLPTTYPRMAPQCRMISPVFHPNIAPHAICIGDHWSAGETLANLIVRIAEMLAYQSYNVKSPLNGKAAQWVEKHKSNVPTDIYDFSSILSKGEVRGGKASLSQSTCSNCGAHGGATKLHACVNGHTTCDACLIPCHRCSKPMCLACDLTKCEICNKVTCPKCQARCANCDALACRNDATRCKICKKISCRNCLVQCAKCESFVCVNHIQKEKTANGTIYNCHTCSAS